MKPRVWLDCTFLWHDEVMLALLTLREAESGTIEAACQKIMLFLHLSSFSIREELDHQGSRQHLKMWITNEKVPKLFSTENRFSNPYLFIFNHFEFCPISGRIFHFSFF